jgi:hypothetical protein
MSTVKDKHDQYHSQLMLSWDLESLAMPEKSTPFLTEMLFALSQ